MTLDDSDRSAILRVYLNALDLDALRARIAEFDAMNFSKLDARQMSTAILNVVSAGDTYSRIVASSSYPPGTVFWRARSLKEESQPPFANMRAVSDAWEPPTAVAGAGRLNQANESLLYASAGSPLGVHLEARVAAESFYALMRYEAIEEIRVTVLQSTRPADLALSPLELEKLELVEQFVIGELFRQAGSNRGYVASEVIAKDFFDLPPDVQHAWAYPSVLHDGTWNVAFRPAEAHSRLRLTGIVGCRPPSLDGQIAAIAFSDGSLYNGEFEWHLMRSPLQQDLFPEFA